MKFVTILVIEITLHDNVFMILDLSLITGAVGQRIRKKPLLVFAYIQWLYE